MLLASRCQRCRTAKNAEKAQGALLDSTEVGGAVPPNASNQQQVPKDVPLKFPKRQAPNRPAWTLPALRRSVVILFLGILAGCIYGIVEINSELVAQGISTLDGVKSYIQDVVGVGDATVGAAGTISNALIVVSTLIDSGINATDITANMECMRPWLDNLPDPGPLRTDLTGISNITSEMAPLLATVAGNFSALVQYNASQGTYSGSLPVLLQSQQQLQDLQSQEEAFSAAAAALTSPFETPGTALAARDALSNLLNNPPTSSKAAMLDAAGSAVQSADVELGNADTDLPQTLTLANQLLQGPAAALNQTLTNQTAAYEAARPCMVALNARSQSINDTIFRLPGALNADLTELQNTQSKLDAVLGVDNNAENLTTVAALDTAMTTAQQQLTSAQSADTQVAAARQTFDSSSGNFSISSFVSALNDTKSSLLAAQGWSVGGGGSYTILLSQAGRQCFTRSRFLLTLFLCFLISLFPRRLLDNATSVPKCLRQRRSNSVALLYIGSTGPVGGSGGGNNRFLGAAASHSGSPHVPAITERIQFIDNNGYHLDARDFSCRVARHAFRTYTPASRQ